jgi:hypothetical protein
MAGRGRGRLFADVWTLAYSARRAPRGGSDFDLDQLVALCPACHTQAEAPYVPGRLVITPLGQGRFRPARSAEPSRR